MLYYAILWVEFKYAIAFKLGLSLHVRSGFLVNYPNFTSCFSPKIGENKKHYQKQKGMFCRGAWALQDKKEIFVIYKVLTEEMYFENSNFNDFYMFLRPLCAEMEKHKPIFFNLIIKANRPNKYYKKKFWNQCTIALNMGDQSWAKIKSSDLAIFVIRETKKNYIFFRSILLV